MSARTRTIRQRIAALIIGLAAVPPLAEVLYRTVRLPGLSPTTNPAYVRHDAELGWAYRPSTHGRHESPVFDVDVEINAQGFRGPDWPAPTPGRPRMLVLGDSFAFGWGVEFEQTFTALLAAETGWDVLNAAVSGYGTDQQRLLLERLLIDEQPDLVLSVFCWNDLFESSAGVVYGKHKPRFVRKRDGLELVGVPVPQPALERWSHAARAFYKWRWQREHMRREIDRDTEWRLVLDLLLEERRLLEDVPLLLLSDRTHLANFARETDGVEHLDLRTVFAGVTEPLAFAGDGHWTPGAHERIARALSSEMKRLLGTDG